MTDLPIAPDKDIDLQGLQHRRRQVLALGIVLLLLLLLVTQSRWFGMPSVHGPIEDSGLLAIVVCIMGRTWCTLYIGGLKKRELVIKGPYSVVRNPLYLFTTIGAAGIGAQTGSIILIMLFAAGSLAVFQVVARKEEAYLAAVFPAEFADYAARVARFWPRPWLWQEADELRVRPYLVRRTFLDASLFLLAVPLVDLIEMLQRTGWLPVFITLP
jgi:protein-S-isoprenylcysteine O-methyltransferase Ste14